MPFLFQAIVCGLSVCFVLNLLSLGVVTIDTLSRRCSPKNPSTGIFVPNLDLFLEILMWRKEKDRDRRLLKRTKPLMRFTFAIMVNMLVNEAFIFVVLSVIHSEP